MKLLFTFLFFALCLGKSSFSQDESFINYTTKDGLPSSQVYDIIQDDYGYLWFSTDKGLSRYDGYEFQNFNKSDGLSDNVVFDLIKQPNGKIWGTTNNASLFYFEGANPTFISYKYNDIIKEAGADKVTHSLYVSKNEDVYLGYHNFLDYLKISKSGELLSVPSHYVAASLDGSSLVVRCVVDDEKDPFYFFSDTIQRANENAKKDVRLVSSNKFKTLISVRTEAMYFNNESTGVFVYNDSIHIKGKDGEITIDASKKIIGTGKLNDDRFWVGYLYGGVSVFNLSGDKINEFLTEKSVTQLFVDHEGHTWISTLERGVFMIRNKSMHLLSDLGMQHITSISKGPDNDLYIGAYDGDIYKRTEQGVTSVFSSSKSHSQPAYIAYDESRKQIYFSNGSVFNLDRTIFDIVHVNYLSIAGNQHVSMGSSGSILYDIVSKEKKKLFGSVRINDALFFKGTLYAGGISGLYKSSVNAKRSYAVQVLDEIRIDDLEIFNDYLVLGTNGDGLLIVDKFLKPIFHIKQQNGLTSDYITKSYTENDSTLWVCTNEGINKVSFNLKTTSFKIEKLDVCEGLASNEVWDLAIENDTIWIGTQSGVNFISKKDFSLLSMKSKEYFLQWTSMHVNDELFEGIHSFKYNQNKLKFRIQGISFAERNDLTYQYKLLGLDQNWSFTKNREITFSSLPPGSYELIVKVKSKNGVEDKNEIRYAFVINPAFWKTWWFYLLCVCGSGAVVYLFFKVRVFTYNKDVVREIMRYILQKIRREEPTILLRENGKDIKVKTGDIHFIRTSGNYLEINLKDKTHVVRSSIAKFIESLPDNIEFIQVHRSYIVRIDKIQQKGKDELVVLDKTIPVGRKYIEELKLIEY